MKRLLSYLLSILCLIFFLTGCQNKITEKTENEISPTNAISTEPFSTQKIEGGKLILKNPTSDIFITLTSDHFDFVYDIVHIASITTESKGEKTLVSDITNENQTYYLNIDNNIQYNDCINIMPADTQKKPTTYEFSSDDFNLSTLTNSSNLISIKPENRSVMISSCINQFNYCYSNKIDLIREVAVSFDIKEYSDILITYDGNKYIIKSTTPIEGLSCSTKTKDEKFTVSKNQKNNMYFISFKENGCPIISTKR